MGKVEFCYVAVPDAKPGYRIALVCRGIRGRYVTDDDDGTPPFLASNAKPGERSIEEYVRELNQRLGVSREEANLMLCGAMLGWAQSKTKERR